MCSEPRRRGQQNALARRGTSHEPLAHCTFVLAGRAANRGGTQLSVDAESAHRPAMPLSAHLQQLLHSEGNFIKTLVIVPTRELAKQIDGLIDGLGYHSPVRSIAVYGGGKGDEWTQQQRAFEEGADIVIGTPGRLIAHMQTGKMKLDKLEHLVLDEADKML